MKIDPEEIMAIEGSATPIIDAIVNTELKAALDYFKKVMFTYDSETMTYMGIVVSKEAMEENIDLISGGMY